MSITAITPLAAGNALRVFLEPPVLALRWRLLRKLTNDISGPTDSGATVVFDGTSDVVLDYTGLVNWTTYYYCVFYWDGAAWTASASVSAVPASTYTDYSTDVLSVVRDRLNDGLQAEVAAGKLFPDSGGVPVLVAPPVWEDARWPLVSVHLNSETPAQRALGEILEPDTLNDAGTEWDGLEGWLAKVTLTIVGWTQNPDERIELRKALRRLIVANLPVFDEVGMLQVEMQLQDMDAVSGEYPAAVYQVMCSFSCLAPARVVTERDAVITNVDVVSTAIEG